METRHLIAYAILAALLVGGTISLVSWRRRREARRLRLRGIKIAERENGRRVA